MSNVDIRDIQENEHLEATDLKAKKVQAWGKTAAGAYLPLKVVDDGSGLGKLSVTFA